MFHYRLIALINRSRMLIAAFLAVALHIGFISFEFELKPVLVPNVSLPRSVSVFLKQRSMTELPVPKEKAQTPKPLPEKQQQVVEIEQEKPVLQNTTKRKEKKDYPVQQPALLEKTVKQSVVEKSIPAAQHPDNIAKAIVPERGEAVNVQEPEIPSKSQVVQENEGVTLPGTLQMAYPRYQSNTPPAYPGLARKRGQEGTVILQVQVNEQGRVDDLEIETSSGYTSLDRAAVSSVKKWNFEPGRRGEERIVMWVRVPVTFKLKN